MVAGDGDGGGDVQGVLAAVCGDGNHLVRFAKGGWLDAESFVAEDRSTRKGSIEFFEGDAGGGGFKGNGVKSSCLKLGHEFVAAEMGRWDEGAKGGFGHFGVIYFGSEPTQ